MANASASIFVKISHSRQVSTPTHLSSSLPSRPVPVWRGFGFQACEHLDGKHTIFGQVEDTQCCSLVWTWINCARTLSGRIASALARLNACLPLRIRDSFGTSKASSSQFLYPWSRITRVSRMSNEPKCWYFNGCSRHYSSLWTCFDVAFRLIMIEQSMDTEQFLDFLWYLHVISIIWNMPFRLKIFPLLIDCYWLPMVWRDVPIANYPARWQTFKLVHFCLYIIGKIFIKAFAECNQDFLWAGSWPSNSSRDGAREDEEWQVTAGLRHVRVPGRQSRSRSLASMFFKIHGAEELWKTSCDSKRR